MNGGAASERWSGKVPGVFAGLLGIGPENVEVRADGRPGAGLVLKAQGRTFVLELKHGSGTAMIAQAIRNLQGQAKPSRSHPIPLVAAPFMGEAGRELCRDAGIGWFDLSGNARVIAPGLRIIIDGRPNLFLSAGRPANLFAPKSSRVARWLLIHPGHAFTQRAIAQGTGMDEGFVSRIVSRLRGDGYLVRDAGGAVRTPDPALLLDAWRETYRFESHAVRRGQVPARTGDALLHFVRDTMNAQKANYAATGLAAAWVYTHFAAFRIATIYLPGEPSPSLLKRLSFSEEPRGANLWLVVPNDAGVFHGAMTRHGVRCVNPVQAYLDLKSHPERAREAAERLRGDCLKWKHDA